MQLQTRMLVVILFLPLLLSSTLGWAYVWEYRKRGVFSVFFAVVSLTVILIALSSSRLSMLPGLRKIRYVPTFLTVPASEQTTYRFDEWNRISQVLYSQNNPVFLVFDWDSLKNDENLDSEIFRSSLSTANESTQFMSAPSDVRNACQHCQPQKKFLFVSR